jgi:hypothetical protein
VTARPNVLERVFLNARAARTRAKEADMHLTPRAAAQLRTLDPADAARVLDTLRDAELGPGSHKIEITTADRVIFRAFIARHRDGSLVLLGVVPARPRAP